ncbi:MAG: hypothetical protein A3C46_02195 [Deltaproteobacteria bacterium RIFCSPHIGHO2_02_FULL_44_16]|nr:MAG: hypothetical protein A3C46_02195 [Deltaproteobacteria bacterium RIFCSPHIGHO2_02_FULL_44_16]
MTPDVALFVNGQKYEGWTEASIKRSVKAISGEFTLSITDNWNGSGSVFFIRIGDEAQVKIGDEVLVTGFVEEIQNSIDAKSHTITVSGRDKTGDLVDCSAIYKSGEIKNADLVKIAQLLIEPFGLAVHAETDVGAAFSSFVVKTGETVFESLERAARLRGVILSSDGFGNLLMTKIGKNRAQTSLIEGQNIKQASITLDTKERYSKYVIKSQMKGTDTVHGKHVSQVKANGDDPVIKRYRPLIVIAEQQANTAETRIRAQWEAAVRAANSSKISVTVQGFEQREGAALWHVNDLVYFESQTLGLSQEFLIADIEMKISASAGRETTMTLQKPDAFIPKPEVEKNHDPVSHYTDFEL